MISPLNVTFSHDRLEDTPYGDHVAAVVNRLDCRDFPFQKYEAAVVYTLVHCLGFRHLAWYFKSGREEQLEEGWLYKLMVGAFSKKGKGAKSTQKATEFIDRFLPKVGLRPRSE